MRPQTFGPRFQRLLAGLVWGAAGLVVVGSLWYRTLWETTWLRGAEVTTVGFAADGVARWAALTFGLGLLALGGLLARRWHASRRRPGARRHGGALLLAGVAGCLLGASLVAGTYWQSLAPHVVATNDQRTLVMTPVTVAGGLPIVVAAGVVGALAITFWLMTAYREPAAKI